MEPFFSEASPFRTRSSHPWIVDNGLDDRAQETLEKLYAPVDARVAEEAYTTFDEFEAERKKVRRKLAAKFSVEGPGTFLVCVTSKLSSNRPTNEPIVQASKQPTNRPTNQ